MVKSFNRHRLSMKKLCAGFTRVTVIGIKVRRI